MPKVCFRSQKWFLRVGNMFPLQLQICLTLLHSQIIKRNNQTKQLNIQITMSGGPLIEI